LEIARPSRETADVNMMFSKRRPMAHATAHRYVVTDPEVLGGEPIINGTSMRRPVPVKQCLWSRDSYSRLPTNGRRI
jgi:hypothetical protein